MRENVPFLGQNHERAWLGQSKVASTSKLIFVNTNTDVTFNLHCRATVRQCRNVSVCSSVLVSATWPSCIARMSRTCRRSGSLIIASVIASLMPRDITAAVAAAAVGSDERCHGGQQASCFRSNFTAYPFVVMCHSLN